MVFADVDWDLVSVFLEADGGEVSHFVELASELDSKASAVMVVEIEYLGEECDD